MHLLLMAQGILRKVKTAVADGLQHAAGCLLGERPHNLTRTSSVLCVTQAAKRFLETALLPSVCNF